MKKMVWIIVFAGLASFAHATWESVGPVAGNVLGMGVVPLAPAHVYISYDDGAVYKTLNNGTDWTTVWTNTAEVADTSWTPMDLNISAQADDQPTVYLRWTMGETDALWRYCGWNVDDVQLTATGGEQPPPPEGEQSPPEGGEGEGGKDEGTVEGEFREV